MARTLAIVAYDPVWPARFEADPVAPGPFVQRVLDSLREAGRL